MKLFFERGFNMSSNTMFYLNYDICCCARIKIKTNTICSCLNIESKTVA